MAFYKGDGMSGDFDTRWRWPYLGIGLMQT